MSDKVTSGWCLPIVLVFVIFFVAAVIFTFNYDSNDTAYHTIYGVTPFDIGDIIHDTERNFGYDIKESETVTGAYIYVLEKENDQITFTIKYESAVDIGVGLAILENAHHPDSTMSDAALYFAERLVTLSYEDAQPDSALIWFKNNLSNEWSSFQSGKGEYNLTKLSEGGTKLRLGGTPIQ